jgi:multimeric flavodoxin WrbA
MKIIAITTSPKGKRSSTLRLVTSAAEAAERGGAEVEYIDVAKLHLKYCIGCAVCHKTGKCPRKDDFNDVVERMLDADGFILSSPNYMEGVTGQMKVFMDRHCDIVHCQKYGGKYSISLATCGGNYGEHIVRFMDTFMVKCGATALGGVGAPVVKDPSTIDLAIGKAYEKGVELITAIKEKRVIPEQEAAHNGARNYFAGLLKTDHRDLWASDYKYFVRKGWIKE